MIAEILSVGTEILLGNIVNTNAHFLSTELASIGVNVFYQTVASDNAKRLSEALDIAIKRSDIIITTGGLGPTEDDLTKETVAKYFDEPLILDNDDLNKIKQYFNKLNLNFTKNNEKQSYFPKNSTILNNNNGTASGCMVEKNGKIVIMLPGPPNEMKPMFLNEVKKILQQKSNEIYFTNFLNVIGVGESLLEEKIKHIIQNQTNPSVALYAGDSQVKIRLTAKANSIEDAKNIIKPIKDELYNILGQNIFSEDDKTLSETIVDLLKQKNLTLAIAESCTGGMIASKIVDVPSASSVFLEGLVTYSNESKVKRLFVSQKTLDEFGAVSSQTAKEMAQGVCKVVNADVSISTTGVAGPTGGTDKKPVGLIYISVNIKGNTTTKEFYMTGNREKIRLRTTIVALDILRCELINSVI